MSEKQFTYAFNQKKTAVEIAEYWLRFQTSAPIGIGREEYDWERITREEKRFIAQAVIEQAEEIGKLESKLLAKSGSGYVLEVIHEQGMLIERQSEALREAEEILTGWREWYPESVFPRALPGRNPRTSETIDLIYRAKDWLEKYGGEK